MMIGADCKPIPNQPIEFNHVRIIPPDGYEIDKENSTFENIVFKKKCADNYESILKELIHPQTHIYGEITGAIYNVDYFVKNHKDKIVLNTIENYQRIVALTKLINVAEYLNNGKKINDYFIYINSDNEIKFTASSKVYSQIRFHTEVLARRAVDILGEKTIRLALGK